MKTAWRMEMVHWSLIAAMFAVATLAWPHVPDRIAAHWNLQGEADGYAGKFMGLMLFPLIAMVLYLILLLLPRFDPYYGNYQSFATAYRVIRISLTLFMAAIYCVMVLVALGYPLDVGAAVSIATAALLIVMGSLMGKIQPNWFVGVRTPWTLSSKRSWTKTHHLAGLLFILLGPLVAATGIVRSAGMLQLTLAVTCVSVGWLIVYSYLIWRNDPERLQPQQTSTAK